MNTIWSFFCVDSTICGYDNFGYFFAIMFDNTAIRKDYQPYAAIYRITYTHYTFQFCWNQPSILLESEAYELRRHSKRQCVAPNTNCSTTVDFRSCGYFHSLFGCSVAFVLFYLRVYTYTICILYIWSRRKSIPIHVYIIDIWSAP